MSDQDREVTWKFSVIGDDSLRRDIRMMGEDSAKQAARHAAAWAKAGDDSAKAVTRFAATFRKETDAAVENALRQGAREAVEFRKFIDQKIADVRRFGAENEKVARDTKKAFADIGKSISKELGAGGIVSAISKGIPGVIAGAGLGAVGMLGAAVRESMALQGLARRIAIDARRPGEKMVDPTTLRKEFEATAIANPGMHAEDVAHGVSAFRVRSGDFDAARRYSDLIAKTSQAFGKSAEEVGAVAGRVFKEFKPRNAEELGDALASINARAKTGGITFEQAASQFQLASMRAKAAGFDMNKVGVRGMNALLGAAGEGGDPERAGQAVGMFMTKLVQNAAKLKTAAGGKKGGLGLDIYSTDRDEHGQAKLRPIQDIIADMLGKARANVPKGTEAGNAAPMVDQLRKMFGGGGKGSPYSVIEPMVEAFNKAYAAAPGTDTQKEKAATEAVLSKFQELESAGGTLAHTLEDTAAVQSSKAAQLTAAWEKVKSAAGEQIAPTLTKLATDLASNQGAIDAVVGSIKLLGKAIEGVVMLLQAVGAVRGGVHTNLAKELEAQAAGAKERGDKLADYDLTDPKTKAAFVKARSDQAGFEAAARRERHLAFEAREDTTIFSEDKNRGWDPKTGQITGDGAPGKPGAPGGAGGAAEHKDAAGAHKEAAGAMTKAAGAVERAADRMEAAARRPGSAFDGGPPGARK